MHVIYYDLVYSCEDKQTLLIALGCCILDSNVESYPSPQKRVYTHSKDIHLYQICGCCDAR